jgi:transposase InsO family protein
MAGVASVSDEKKLEDYFNPEKPGSFSGAEKFQRSLDDKIGVKKIRDFLKTKDSYTLHFPVRRKFPRSRVIVASMGQMFDGDLLFMTDLRDQNDGWAYILTCIDVLSKMAFCERLKTKTSAEVAGAFKKVLMRAKQHAGFENGIRVYRSDSGSEFLGKPFKTVLEKNGIKHFLTLNSDVKACISERSVRYMEKTVFFGIF